MRIVLFDAILEQHTVESLRRALQARGHEVTWTGPLWRGHHLPEAAADLEPLWAQVRTVAQDRPGAVLNFRASSLRPEMVAHLKSAGAHTLVWLPDDPVLYHLCYRHVVAAYDTLLHCGPEDMLAFYQQKHGRAGVNFPFWTDAEAFPRRSNPGRAEMDLVFLGNCHGQVRNSRYELLGSLPFRTRIFGKVPDDPLKLCAGYLADTPATAAALGRALAGVNIPQVFRDYAGSEYDFPELAGFSHFEFPSRVIQYAACGLPILSLEPRGTPRTFPELVACRDRDELVAQATELLRDMERLRELSAATHARFERSFSAAARAALLERLIASPAEWRALDLRARAECFATVLPEERTPHTRPPARATVRPSTAELPPIDEQREMLRTTVIESPRRWRILYFAASSDQNAQARQRALINLGHTVMNVDAALPPAHDLEPLRQCFKPQGVVCDGLALAPPDATDLQARGVLLLGVSSAAVAPTVTPHAFDYVLAPAEAVAEWRSAGATNAVLMPPGTDRAVLLAEVDSAPNSPAAADRRERVRRRAFRRLARGRLWEHRWLDVLATIERDVFVQPMIVSAERAAVLRDTLSQSAPRPRRVVISGFYGAQNTGDELILRAIAEGVRRLQPDVQFVVASEDSAAVQRLHGCSAFQRKDVAAGQAEVAAAAAVVLGGGGLWHDYTFLRAGDLAGLFSNTVLSLPGFAKLPLLARMYGRPFHVFGVGVGPLRQRNAQRFLRHLGEQAQSITVRDAESRTLLEGIPGWNTPVACAPDVVYALDVGTPVVPGPVAEIQQQSRFLAVNLRPWPGATAGRLYERVAQALEQVARRSDCALVGVPLQGGPQDRVVLDRVFAMIRIPRPAVVLEWTSQFEELLGTLQASAGVLAMRLHACLLAHRLGRPVVGIHYDPKVQQHFDELGRAECSLPVDAATADFVAQLETLLAQDGVLPQTALCRVREMETGARAAIDTLAQRLAEAPPVTEVAPLVLPSTPPAPTTLKTAEAGPDADFEEPLASLEAGALRAGSLSNAAAQAQVVSRRQTHHLWFHQARSDPRQGDFAEFALSIPHGSDGGHTALVRVRSPYERPKNEGRLAYQIVLNGRVLLEEDISLWGDTNDVRITWQVAGPTSTLAIRVIALRDCEPWNWGRAGRIVIQGITHRPQPWTSPPRVLATSPFSRIIEPGEAAVSCG